MSHHNCRPLLAGTQLPDGCTSRMPLLTGCINEALRLYPAATGISRISAVDAEYGPHWLPRGSILLLDIYSAHRQAHTPALELPRTAHSPCIVSVCTYMLMATTAPDVRWCIAALTVCSCYCHDRHPDFWSQPLEFLPERWLPGSDMGPRHPDAFVPFGTGVRGCIGRAFAMLEMQARRTCTRCASSCCCCIW